MANDRLRSTERERERERERKVKRDWSSNVGEGNYTGACKTCA